MERGSNEKSYVCFFYKLTAKRESYAVYMQGDEIHIS